MSEISGLTLGVLCIGLVAFAIFLWFRLMNAGTLYGRRRFVWGMFAIAIGIGLVAITRDPGWVGGALATVGILMGAFQLALGWFARQSTQAPKLELGEPLPAFSAPDHQGQPFEIESLRGHPVIIKLFRGNW